MAELFAADNSAPLNRLTGVSRGVHPHRRPRRHPRAAALTCTRLPKVASTRSTCREFWGPRVVAGARESAQEPQAIPQWLARPRPNFLDTASARSL
jgi:hypothetical protein